MNLAPDQFWRLTPREWRWLCAALAPEPAPRRADFAALLAQFPDEGRRCDASTERSNP
ncbi:phage tail assembly chaperone [Amphiplicatus metriothermophilus]|uniref:Phage tail assembly chaperone protein, TAC n=1 Tax=Amphiplicatus metriothermophilus TaxID=1519374 RepID=A0A239PJR9_9PROT|nr:phage tail assembly chaperone [Amphiplicatus metriothermophilus]MBB5518093.1 putative phage protein (TIGR02216 family) [Amphiplicatus metriothermophilus]SNT67573.1 phage conserved hypothetical protein [Amphiplicatus metriothermophilus]